MSDDAQVVLLEDHFFAKKNKALKIT